MRLRSTWILAALACVTSASAALAQQPKQPIKPAVIDENGQVHRIVIMNGTNPQVHYVGVNLSSSDQAALRDLERAEAELANLNLLNKYRSDLIQQERDAIAQRDQMRTKLMHTASSIPITSTSESFSETRPTNAGLTLSSFLAPFTFQNTGYGGGFPFLGTGTTTGAGTPTITTIPTATVGRTGSSSIGGATTAGAGSTIGAPLGTGASAGNSIFPATTNALLAANGAVFPGVGLFNNGLLAGGFGGYGGYGGYPGMGGPYPVPQATITETLRQTTDTQAIDMLAKLSQDAGGLKTELLSGKIPTVSPEAAERAEGNYLAALNRVNQSDSLRLAMAGKAAPKKGSIVLAGIPDVDVGATVTVKYKGAAGIETAEGPLVRDDAQFIVVRTAGGRMSIAKNQVLTILVKD
jgi:hypothetical protein